MKRLERMQRIMGKALDEWVKYENRKGKDRKNETLDMHDA